MKLLTLILLLCFTTPLVAQDFVSLLVPTKERTRVELNGLISSSADKNPETKTAVSERSAGVESKLYGSGIHHFSMGARWKTLDFAENVNGLRDYNSFSGNFTYRRDLPQNNFWSLAGSYGTASDRPFKDGRDATLGMTYIQKMNARWIFLMNYSNNRVFLNNVPLPGFAYLHTMSRERTLLFGFPFLFWNEQLNNDFKLRVLTILPFIYNVRLLYRTSEKAELYLGLEQSAQVFFDSRREADEDRIFWTEKKIGLGLESEISKQIKYDFQSGFAFDRTLYQAESFGSSEKDSLLHMGSALYVSLVLKIGF